MSAAITRVEPATIGIPHARPAGRHASRQQNLIIFVIKDR
jgi:hypothetical protein